MFAWPSHSAGDVTVGVLIEQVANRDYDAAAHTLAALIDRRSLTRVQADRLRDLLSQAQRLAADQERLAEVVAGLAYDETSIQSRLLNAVEIPTENVGDHALAERQPAAPTRPLQPAPQLLPHVPSKPPCDVLAIRLLGSCEIEYNEALLDIDNGDRAGAVLRFLAAQPDSGVHKEQLAAEFWPDANDRAARRSLHQVVYNLRRRLAEIGADGELRFHNDRYVLGGPDRWRDVDEVEQFIAAARVARGNGDCAAFVASYEQAENLFGGEFLGEHLYAEWAEVPRQHYRQLRLETVDVLLNEYQRREERCRVVDLAQRYLKSEPTNESVARQLMRAHAELGQPDLAVAVFTNQSQILADQLGLSPDPESQRLIKNLQGTSSER